MFVGRPVLAAFLLLLVFSCPPWDTGRGLGALLSLGGRAKPYPAEPPTLGRALPATGAMQGALMAAGGDGNSPIWGAEE